MNVFLCIGDLLGLKMINWANLVSDSLDIQLRELGRTKIFYMSSYVVYA